MGFVVSAAAGEGTWGQAGRTETRNARYLRSQRWHNRAVNDRQSVVPRAVRVLKHAEYIRPSEIAL